MSLTGDDLRAASGWAALYDARGELQRTIALRQVSPSHWELTEPVEGGVGWTLYALVPGAKTLTDITSLMRSAARPLAR